MVDKLQSLLSDRWKVVIQKSDGRFVAEATKPSGMSHCTFYMFWRAEAIGETLDETLGRLVSRIRDEMDDIVHQAKKAAEAASAASYLD